jgi:hypothetical protein
MLTKLIKAVAIVALLGGSAAAQMPMPSIHLGGDKAPLTPEQQEKQKAIDEAYQSANKKIPDKKPIDPWGNIRGNADTGSKGKR